MAEFVSQRGLRWHYDVTGSGDPIVLIHGFGASGNIWRNQVEALRLHHQVLTVDLPGHGRSSWMPMTTSDFAFDLRQLIESVGLPQLSIVASSFGGLVAFELYRLLGEHVMRMSLVGAIPKFARGPNYPAGLDIDKIRTLSRQFDGDYAQILDMFFRSLFSMKERQSEQFRLVKLLRAAEILPQREALKAYLDLLEKTDLRDRLASTICPLQFVAGSEDYICPRPIMDWVAEHAFNARFDFMEGCGHLPFLTEVQEYNRLLEDFLIS